MQNLVRYFSVRNAYKYQNNIRKYDHMNLDVAYLVRPHSHHLAMQCTPEGLASHSATGLAARISEPPIVSAFHACPFPGHVNPDPYASGGI